MTSTSGYCDDRFASVRDVLEGQLERGEDVGASVCVMWRGEKVVDLWGGMKDAERDEPWVEDTLVNVWSTTKTMTFLSVLMLMDRGELDPDRPVAAYWPEFAAEGKGDITLANVMSHSAGLSGFDAPMGIEELADWDGCVERLARQRPWWDDRTLTGYHALTQGYLIGEVIRRVTGSSFGSFLRDEVATPLNADFFVGLPESEEGRVSLVTHDFDPPWRAVAPDSICARSLSTPPIEADAPRHRWWRAAEIPAANGHGNARSVALIQSVLANGGEAEGRRFFSRETAEQVFTVRAGGVDQVLLTDLNYGLGYGLASSAVPVGPRTAFWGGYGGSLVMVDLDLELTIAYTMNRMHIGLIGDQRGVNLATAAMFAAATN